MFPLGLGGVTPPPGKIQPRELAHCFKPAEATGVRKPHSKELLHFSFQKLLPSSWASLFADSGLTPVGCLFFGYFLPEMGFAQTSPLQEIQHFPLTSDLRGFGTTYLELEDAWSDAGVPSASFWVGSLDRG